MFENVLDVIKKTGIFMVVAQTLLHLCGGENYEKYIKMLLHIIMAVMLAVPIAEGLKEGSIQSFEAYVKEFEETITKESLDFEKIRDEAWQNAEWRNGL